MLSRALLIAAVAFALFAALEEAARFHPIQLAADAMAATSCEGWSREACDAARKESI